MIKSEGFFAGIAFKRPVKDALVEDSRQVCNLSQGLSAIRLIFDALFPEVQPKERGVWLYGVY